MCERCKKEYVSVLLYKQWAAGKLDALLHEVYEAGYAEGYVDASHDAECQAMVEDVEPIPRTNTWLAAMVNRLKRPGATTKETPR